MRNLVLHALHASAHLFHRCVLLRLRILYLSDLLRRNWFVSVVVSAEMQRICKRHQTCQNAILGSVNEVGRGSVANRLVWWRLSPAVVAALARHFVRMLRPECHISELMSGDESVIPRAIERKRLVGDGVLRIEDQN